MDRLDTLNIILSLIAIAWQVRKRRVMAREYAANLTEWKREVLRQLRINAILRENGERAERARADAAAHLARAESLLSRVNIYNVLEGLPRLTSGPCATALARNAVLFGSEPRISDTAQQ